MAVPANICVAWPSTVASIPAGWTREAALDSRYIMGSAANGDTDLTTDRGSANHTHTSPSHTPVQDSHTHEFRAPFGDASSTIVSGTLTGIGADGGHTHGSKPSAATTATNNGIAITVDATSNDLAFVEVIWIKSDGTPATLPINCLAFFASDSLPLGWSRVHGDRYLKGAAAGNNGGGTGGSNTHTHSSPAHTHTQNAHAHAPITSLITTETVLGRSIGSDSVSSAGHTHSVELDSSVATNQSVTTTIDAGDHEPPFRKLNVLQSASATLPDQIIALWLGTNATIPADWSRYTAMDSKWLKGSAADGEVGSTGGSTQHSHAASDCQPTQDVHTHTVTGGSGAGAITSAVGSANNFAAPGHFHTWEVDSAVATNQSVAVTIDLCAVDAALPKHRTVIFVQFTPSAGPGPSLGGVTTYDIGFPPFGANEEQLGGKPLPEVLQKRWAGDSRYFPHEPML